MDHLITEARNPASTNLDELSALEFVQLMNAEDAKVIPAIGAQAEVIAQAIDFIADRLRAGGRLVYVGAGTSGRLGVLDASECPPTFNAPPGQVVGIIAGGSQALTQSIEGAEDHPEYAVSDLQAIAFSNKDVLVGIASSGRTPYVIGATEYARKISAFTIGFSCNPESDLSAAVDLPITATVGPEVLSGSTRLKAGTATKLVLNMLTTGAMVRMGKTYGNLMVDLRATNNKLRARTNRIVRILTGLSMDEADALLQEAGGELKTALVMQLGKIDADEARRRLQNAGGQISAVLHQPRVADPKIIDELLLGIDGGGTSTTAILARERNGEIEVLGKGGAGPSNLRAVGLTQTCHSIDEAVQRAFAAAGLRRQRAASAVLGLAGAGRGEEQASVKNWAERVGLAERIHVTDDVSLLLAAGAPDGVGLAIVAGTGSIIFGRNAKGESARAGGWGYLLGDEGSAYALVIAALRAVVRAADGIGPKTSLTERFIQRFGITRPQELIAVVYGGERDRKSLAQLAPIVLAESSTDEVAKRIIDDGAMQLAALAQSVIRQLQWKDDAPAVALAGGLLVGNADFRELVLEQMRLLSVPIGEVAVVNEPALGAVALVKSIRGCR